MERKKKKETPTILYHYTSQNGLLGIVGNKNSNMKLWCSEIKYLNDAAEFKYCFDLIQELIIDDDNQDLGGDVSNDILDAALWFVKTFTNPNGTEVKMYFFVSCFSRERDCLSQWRAYCPEGKGFCLGFNYAKLSYLSLNQNFRFVECIYNRNDQVKKIRELIDASSKLSKSLRAAHKRGKFTAAEKKLIVNLFPQQSFTKPESVDHLLVSDFEHLIQNFILNTALMLIALAPQFKDPSFREEREWRLVSPLVTQQSGGDPTESRIDSNIKFRQGKSMIIPYIEFKLTDEERNNCPITEVVVGPTPHVDLSKQSLRALLNSNGLDTCKVEGSQIPFRAW